MISLKLYLSPQFWREKFEEEKKIKNQLNMFFFSLEPPLSPKIKDIINIWNNYIFLIGAAPFKKTNLNRYLVLKICFSNRSCPFSPLLPPPPPSAHPGRGGGRVALWNWRKYNNLFIYIFHIWRYLNSLRITGEEAMSEIQENIFKDSTLSTLCIHICIKACLFA